MFGIKKDPRKISSLGYSFRFDDKYLYFSGLRIQGFRILKEDIESVSVDANTEKGTLQGTWRLLKINGRGTLLGQAKVQMGFAEKAQDFILEEIKNNKKGTSQSANSNLDEIEKLASLKEKGIITEDEFQAKKKQLLAI